MEFKNGSHNPFLFLSVLYKVNENKLKSNNMTKNQFLKLVAFDFFSLVAMVLVYDQSEDMRISYMGC